MGSVQEIKSAISKLSDSELRDFRAWFDKYDAKNWDNQFENDVRSGKLDKVAEEAISDFKAGKYKEI